MSVLFILFIIAFALLVLYGLYKLFMGSGGAGVKVIWVILLLVLGASFYLLYTYFFKKKSTLVSSVHLKGSTPTVIASKDIEVPNSPNSAFGVWVYVNSWNSNSEKYVFSASGSIVTSQFSLFFDRSKPSLFCQVKTGCTAETQSIEKILITDSFPMQKWVYVIVSLNGAFIDCYIDGKLITSHKLNDAAVTLACTGNTLEINMGTDFDAYVYNFIRYTNAMTPQQAYKTFYSTAPSGSSTGFFTGMNINLAVVTNGDTCKATKIL